MLQTKDAKPILAIGGINQQDFKEIQLVSGTFPYQKGLQQRIPGKSLISTNPNGIGSIYVFYLVLGRHYNLVDFGTGLTITETPLEPITLPALPPFGNTWFDNFNGYAVDLVSRLWGAGLWATDIGVCETIIQGIIDPFLVYATIAPGRENPIPDLQPIPGPPPQGTIPPTDPGSPNYLYPPGHQPDLILINRTGTLVAPPGDETLPQNVAIPDQVDYEVYSGSGFIDTLVATSITIGDIVPFHSITVGRQGDIPFGDASMGAPGQPHYNPDLPQPPTLIKYFTLADGEIGVHA